MNAVDSGDMVFLKGYWFVNAGSQLGSKTTSQTQAFNSEEN